MPKTLVEAQRETLVRAEYDVLVCGAGPAGIGAALAAARAGARTGLIEVHGCLGGIWTAGLLSSVVAYKDRAGIIGEIMNTLEARDGRGRALETGEAISTYDAELMKRVLEEMCIQAGIAIRLYTRVVGVARDSTGRLTHVIGESKSGREAFAAKVFIDTSGDGDLAALAGCGFDVGDPQDGKTQPMSLMALVGGLDPVAAQPFYRKPGYGGQDHKKRLTAEMQRGGVSPSYTLPTLFPIRGDLFALMANHEYDNGLDADRLTQATLRARREIHELISKLRALGGVWANLRLVATAEQIGVREGRRIHGQYTVSAEDMRVGRRHEDAVCTLAVPIDVHSTNPSHDKGILDGFFKVQPYDIPLRALIARDAPNLLMAGRCISGDFLAHASYRMTGIATPLGEAAGQEAARQACSLPEKRS